MKRVIIDIETEKLENPQHIHCIVTYDVDTGEENVFEEDDIRLRFHSYGNSVDTWIGHHIIGFDLPVLVAHGLLRGFNPRNCIDTLIVSRIINYGMAGGHSLENWGETLGFPKSTFADFSQPSKKLTERCRQDVKINLEIFKFLSKYIYSNTFSNAIGIESELSSLLTTLNTNGFPFNLKDAIELHKNTSSILSELTEEIKKEFTPRTKLLKVVEPKLTKDGILSSVPFKFLKKGLRDDEAIDLTPYSPSCPFSVFEWVEFNPKSPKQVVERLNEAGWKPTVKTKGHSIAEKEKDEKKLERYRTYGWQICEENIQTLPEDAPAATRKLVRWLMLDSRRSTLEEWFNAYNPETKKIHGRFLHIGSWPHRMAHQAPNMGNVPAIAPKYTDKTLFKEASELGGKLRALWTHEGKGRKLIGVDADGIHMRIFAHYLQEPKLIESLVKGKKEDETDIHSLHKRAINTIETTRDQCKTFIYSLLNGAGIGKIGSIFGCDLKTASQIREDFYNFYPGLRKFREEIIPADAKRGYFIGLDGRKVIIPGENFRDKQHLALAGYLQNGEKIIMSRACIHWNNVLQYKKIPYWFRNFIHDEFQTETLDDPELLKIIQEVQIESIVRQGDELKLNCPLAANSRVGDNWLETH